MTSYRLGQYRIIEDQYGSLRWESYFGFARTKTGRCFIAGTILFLEPSTEIDEPGFLIDEYKQLIDRLPQWTKTKYYCAFYTMNSCNSGTTLPLKTIDSQTPERREAVTNGLIPQAISALNSGVNLSRHPRAVCYRLARYKIVEGERGGLWWITYAGLGRLKSGTCFLEGDILFIGHPEKEEEGTRKKFVEQLRHLPNWEKSNYYCSRYTLQTCNPGKTGSAEAISNRLEKRTKRTSNSFVSDICNAAILLGHTGNAEVRLKKWVSRIRKWVAFIRVHLPF